MVESSSANQKVFVCASDRHGSVCASLQNRLNAMNTSVIHIQLYGFMPEAVPAFYEWLCCEIQGLSEFVNQFHYPNNADYNHCKHA